MRPSLDVSRLARSRTRRRRGTTRDAPHTEIHPPKHLLSPFLSLSVGLPTPPNTVSRLGPGSTKRMIVPVTHHLIFFPKKFPGGRGLRLRFGSGIKTQKAHFNPCWSKLGQNKVYHILFSPPLAWPPLGGCLTAFAMHSRFWEQTT